MKKPFREAGLFSGCFKFPVGIVDIILVVAHDLIIIFGIWIKAGQNKFMVWGAFI